MAMRAFSAAGWMLCLGLTAFGAAVSAEPSRSTAAYRVIVNPKNPVTAVDRQFLEDAFFKRVTRWPDDRVIRPADLHTKSSARSRFSREVLDRSVAAVRAYWQQRVFSGRGVPPPEFGTEEQVIQYVLQHEGAVGYVSGSAELKGSKLVVIRR